MSKECEKYLALAAFNEDAALKLSKSCPKTVFHWLFVIIFYSALHYFYAILENKSKEIPTIHKSKNVFDLGCLDLAESELYTVKNNINDSVGEDFKTLFQWSHDARYNTSRYRLLTDNELKQAFNILEAVKMIAMNETGHFVKISGRGNAVINPNQETQKNWINSVHRKRIA